MVNEFQVRQLGAELRVGGAAGELGFGVCESLGKIAEGIGGGNIG